MSEHLLLTELEHASNVFVSLNDDECKKRKGYATEKKMVKGKRNGIIIYSR